MPLDQDQSNYYFSAFDSLLIILFTTYTAVNKSLIVFNFLF